MTILSFIAISLLDLVLVSREDTAETAAAKVAGKWLGDHIMVKMNGNPQEVRSVNLSYSGIISTALMAKLLRLCPNIKTLIAFCISAKFSVWIPA